MPANHADKIY